MIDKRKIATLVEFIDAALVEADVYVSKYYNGNPKSMEGTKKALRLFRQELLDKPEDMNERVLRAMRDVGAQGVKSYEMSTLGDAINKISIILYTEMPGFKNLPVLGMDFGKGDPI